MYSPTTCLISSRSSSGYVYFESVDGARKQLIISPFTRLGGNVWGTPSTTTCLPTRDRMSQTRSSFIFSAVANASPS